MGFGCLSDTATVWNQQDNQQRRDAKHRNPNQSKTAVIGDATQHIQLKILSKYVEWGRPLYFG